jgi:hypothetical protein
MLLIDFLEPVVVMMIQSLLNLQNDTKEPLKAALVVDYID